MKNGKIFIFKTLFFIILLIYTACSKNDDNIPGPGDKVTGIYELLVDKLSNNDSRSFQFVSEVEIVQSNDSENKFLLYRLETFTHDSLGTVIANINNNLEINISQQVTLAPGSPTITGNGQITNSSISLEYNLDYSSDLIENYTSTGTKL